MNKYLCIGIDPGYKSSATGIALVSGGKLLASFHRYLAGEYPGQRIRSFRDLLINFIRDVRRGIYGPDCIGLLAWEEPHVRFINAVRGLFYLEAVLYLECEDLLLPYTPVNNKIIKKTYCGSGGADKDDMKRAAERLVGYKIDDQNEADAVLVAFYAEKIFTERG